MRWASAMASRLNIGLSQARGAQRDVTVRRRELGAEWRCSIDERHAGDSAVIADRRRDIRQYEALQCDAAVRQRVAGMPLAPLDQRRHGAVEQALAIAAHADAPTQQATRRLALGAALVCAAR